MKHMKKQKQEKGQEEEEEEGEERRYWVFSYLGTAGRENSVILCPLPVTPTLPSNESGDLKMLSFLRAPCSLLACFVKFNQLF